MKISIKQIRELFFQHLRATLATILIILLVLVPLTIREKKVRSDFKAGERYLTAEKYYLSIGDEEKAALARAKAERIFEKAFLKRAN